MKYAFGLAILSISALSSDVFAQLKSENSAPGRIVKKQIIEEIVHDFEVTSYPEDRIVGSQNSLDGFSPEATLDKWVTALRQSGYTEVMAFWDEAARVKQNNESLKVGKTPSQWESDWRNLLKDKSVRYQYKLAYGPYVLFDLEFRDSANETAYRELIAMRRQQQEWKLTRDLADSVVVQHWKSRQSRVRRLASPLYKKVDGK